MKNILMIFALLVLSSLTSCGKKGGNCDTTKETEEERRINRCNLEAYNNRCASHLVRGRVLNSTELYTSPFCVRGYLRCIESDR